MRGDRQAGQRVPHPPLEGEWPYLEIDATDAVGIFPNEASITGRQRPQNPHLRDQTVLPSLLVSSTSILPSLMEPWVACSPNCSAPQSVIIFIAMNAFAGGPVGLADARAVIDQNRESLDLQLLRRLAHRFGRDTAKVVGGLIGVAEAGVLLIRNSDGHIVVQRRNTAGTQAPVDYWFTP